MKNLITILACGSLLVASLAGQDVAKEDQEEYVLRMYSIEEITQQLAERDWGEEADPPNPELRRNETGQRIVRMLRSFMPGAEKLKRVAVAQLGGLIISVSAPLEQQRWCEKFLRNWKAQLKHLIMIQVRILTTTPEILEDLALGEEAKVLPSEKELEKLLERLSAEKGISLVTCPRVACLNGQQANVSVINQIAYIKRYDVHERVEPERKRLVDPVVDVIQDGIVWDILPVTLDEKNLGLDMKLTVSSLKRPMETRETEYGEICIPEVSNLIVETTMILGDGAAAMFTTSEHMGQRLLLIIRAHKIDPGKVEEQLWKEVRKEPGARKSSRNKI